VTQIAKNISVAAQMIRSLEEKYSRPESSVKLLAVSKRHSVASIRQAAKTGITDFGENFVQEAEGKMTALADLQLNWHFIGPIQSNKTRRIAENFDWVQSLDREKLAHRLNEQRANEKTALNVCIQINLSQESSKSGISLESAETLGKLVNELPNLCLRGLMAIPAPETNLDRQRKCFAKLALEFYRMRELFPTMDTLSMGMSKDFEAAIAEGSTMVRIGTALFGPRV
jgi:pyridoxal phosphate enzyme (YggS family)